MMFHEIPPSLTENLIDLLENIPKSDRFELEAAVAAAHLVITAAINRHPEEWTTDPWLGFKIENDKISNFYNERILQIASMLFSLIGHPAIEEIQRRLQTRTMREVTYEIAGAHAFSCVGFTLHAKPEIYVKGADFDFEAHIGDQVVHVEVKEFSGDDYSEKTLNNALKKKSKQIPATNPSVLVMYYPEDWNVKYPNVSDLQYNHIVDWLSKHKRFNQMIITEESINENSQMDHQMRTIPNQKPSHPFFGLILAMFIRSLLSGLTYHDASGHYYGASVARFYRWVRYAVRKAIERQEAPNRWSLAAEGTLVRTSKSMLDCRQADSLRLVKSMTGSKPF